MKYVIDLPDDYDYSWVGVDMLIDIKGDGTTYKRYSVPLEPYKPEPEPKREAFEVGDEVENSDGEYGYVLITNYKNDNDVMVLLMYGYAMPQIIRKIGWVKTGKNNKSVKELIRLAYEALNEVNE